MLLIIAGTRPEIVKVAPVINILKKKGISYVFVWTRQHYDYEMCKIFFEQLKIPEPDIYLGIPTSSDDEVTKLFDMSIEIARIIRKKQPMAVYALGDTLSTLSAALSSIFSGIPFIHDEAGMRSFNTFMLEEISRRICDHVATFRFAPTKIALLNLLFEGIRRDTIKLVGSTLVDSLLKILPIINKIKDKTLERFKVEKERYIVLTIHRRENLMHNKLKNLVMLLKELDNILRTEDIKIIFPVHPHTRKKLAIHSYYDTLKKLNQLVISKPLGYIEFLSLLKNGKLVITDSGGVQEEAFLLGKRIITLRSITEWPETVILGYNKLAEPSNVEHVVRIVGEALHSSSLSPPSLEDNPLGDGNASLRIASGIKIFLENLSSSSELVRHYYKFMQNFIYLIPYLDNIEVIKNSLSRLTNTTICFDNKNRVPIYRISDSNSDIILCSKRIPLIDIQQRINLNEYVKVKWHEEDKGAINP